MHVSAFDFTLPPHSIAHYPAEPRDSARLLHVGATRADRIVRELPELLNPGDILVFNDSRVIPARLFCRVGEKQIEVLLHQLRPDGLWSAFARPAKKLKPGML
ncbi:MAG: tRNA preQ1(34) S-adenosylmethionine ribosyltransferase-isomerase QueA, partial [Azospirillum brasilense]